MGRRRYETYCGGRLLKAFEQVEIPPFDRPPYASPGEADAAGRLYRAQHGDDIPTVDADHYWVIDGQVVAEDVAQAMLAKYGDHDR